MKRIEMVHVFIVVDEDGTEGVPAIQANGTWIPMVAADSKRLGQLRPIAQALATEHGNEIKLVRFNAREDLETLHPEGQDPART